jgi:hypothetical protein
VDLPELRRIPDTMCSAERRAGRPGHPAHGSGTVLPALVSPLVLAMRRDPEPLRDHDNGMPLVG